MLTYSPSVRRALAALFALALIWGYNWVVMKRALAYMGPFQFAAARMLLAALMLFAVVIVTKRPWRPRALPQTLLIGLLQTCGFSALIMRALLAGGAGKVAVLSYTMPFWVMLLAWPLLGDLLSDVLAVAAGLCWALAVILAKRLHRRGPDVDVLAFTAWQMFMGALSLLALAAVIPAPPTHWTPYLVGALAYNVIACNALAWPLWLFALQRLPAGITGMISLLTQVVAVLAAWLELAEVPTTLEVLGMVLIGAALVAIAGQSTRRHETTAPTIAQE